MLRTSPSLIGESNFRGFEAGDVISALSHFFHYSNSISTQLLSASLLHSTDWALSSRGEAGYPSWART